MGSTISRGCERADRSDGGAGPPRRGSGTHVLAGHRQLRPRTEARWGLVAGKAAPVRPPLRRRRRRAPFFAGGWVLWPWCPPEEGLLRRRGAGTGMRERRECTRRYSWKQATWLKKKMHICANTWRSGGHASVPAGATLARPIWRHTFAITDFFFHVLLLDGVLPFASCSCTCLIYYHTKFLLSTESHKPVHACWLSPIWFAILSSSSNLREVNLIFVCDWAKVIVHPYVLHMFFWFSLLSISASCYGAL